MKEEYCGNLFVFFFYCLCVGLHVCLCVLYYVCGWKVGTLDGGESAVDT